MRGSRLLRSLFLESPAAAHGGIAVGHDLTMVDGGDSRQREFPQLSQKSQGESMKREMFDSLCEDWEIGPSLWRQVVGSGSGSWTRDVAGAVEGSRKSVRQRQLDIKGLRQWTHDK